MSQHEGDDNHGGGSVSGGGGSGDGPGDDLGELFFWEKLLHVPRSGRRCSMKLDAMFSPISGERVNVSVRECPS